MVNTAAFQELSIIGWDDMHYRWVSSCVVRSFRVDIQELINIPTCFPKAVNVKCTLFISSHQTMDYFSVYLLSYSTQLRNSFVALSDAWGQRGNCKLIFFIIIIIIWYFLCLWYSIEAHLSLSYFNVHIWCSGVWYSY